uniref:ATP synthase complex subunit 8 n=1 Tax=Panstrongylus rufotuberculatus TaxID=156443 RepID=A0A4Y5T7R9_9HEMI|nr:ATP synthase F0 subunit 8 [Panstrongylus rufotuberculatus]QDB64198.1 ATP synthase F0 subunit 8 [Panstrongylus rufotuberculatus]
MPQMAPAWWTILFFTFTLSFLVMSFLLYYQTYSMPQMNKNNTMTQPKNNWMW